MKILAIRGKNLASIEGEFIIDFTNEPLKSAGIFAITGPTGSGKSTILDALCLALFAQSPRQAAAVERGVELADGESGRISQNDPRSILRKGTSDGFAEVDFVGLDKNHYRSRWSVRRARNKTSGNLQDYTIQLLNISNGAIYPEKKTETLREIERLIGLNYDQFTRSVLLAQGDFTAFLKAGRDEKSALLEKLTGTAIYTEISKSIYEKTKASETYYQEINNRLSGIMLLDEPSKQELISQKTEIEKQLLKLTQQKELCRKELDWHEQIEKLTENLKTAEINLEETEKRKADSAERFSRLNLVELVQPARNLFATRNEKSVAIQKKQSEKNKLSENYSTIDSQLELQKVQQKEEQKALENAEKAYTDAKPLLKKASEMDTLIGEYKKNIADTTNEVESVVLKIKTQEQYLNDHNKQIDSLSSEINEITQWLEINQKRQPIVENFLVIKEALQGAAKLASEEKTLVNKSSILNLKYEDLGKENTRLSESHKQQILIIENTRAKNEELQNKINALSPDELRKREHDISETLQQIIEANACWESLHSSQNDLARLMNDRIQTVSNLKIHQTNIEKCTSELQESNIRRHQTKTLLDQAKLRIAENVEALRSQLSDKEPCPVCGSREHPYTSADNSFHSAIAEFQDEYSKWSASYDEKVKELAFLEGNINKCNEDIGRISLEVEKIEKRNATLILKWTAYTLPESILLANDPIRSEVFKTEIESRKVEASSIRQKLNEYQNLKVAFNENTARLEKLKDEQTERERQISEYSKQLSLLEQENAQIIKRINEIQVNYKETISRLNVWFVLPDWVENWSSNPELFVIKLGQFSDEWISKNRRLDELKNKLKVAIAESTLLKNQLEGLHVNHGQVRLKLEKLKGENSNMLSERNTIFNGITVSEAESAFSIAIEKSISSLNKSQLITKTLQSEKDGLTGKLNQIDKDLISLKAEADEAGKRVNDWLNDFNSTGNNLTEEADLLSLLSFNNDWIEEERKALQQISDSVLTAKTTLQERKTQMEIHHSNRMSENGKEIVILNLQKFDEEIKNMSSLKSEVEFRLREDQNNRKTVGNLLNELEKRKLVWEQWQKLNDLLGSADGKKFRQIAQEYTLDVLLGFANIHLKELSGRYELQVVPDSLALQVVDHDMGNEVRSVHSLSGGESFLVSLALALGLASLSSQRMNVESLFIDEGFGSLDPVTLNIAMDALEQLHNQGRKVGVISHVQEMTERILTKIEVKKLSGGKSKVLIFNK